jgi:hypothetical protein
MKKIIYLLLFVASTIVTVTSCTEEEVKPKSELDSGNGGLEDEGIKRG